MKSMLITLVASLGIALHISSQASTQAVDLSTCVVNGSTGLIVPPSNDDTWKVLVPAAASYASVTCSTGSLIDFYGVIYPNTWASTPSAEWISPSVDANGLAK